MKSQNALADKETAKEREENIMCVHCSAAERERERGGGTVCAIFNEISQVLKLSKRPPARLEGRARSIHNHLAHISFNIATGNRSAKLSPESLAHTSPPPPPRHSFPALLSF